MVRYELSYEKAREVIPILVNAYKNKKGLFGYNEIFPELPLPKNITWNSYDHFNWWFVTVLSDHSTSSVHTYEKSRQLHDKIIKDNLPNIFDPKIVTSLDLECIDITLKKMCHGANNHPLALKDNSIRLVNEYDGNPKNIFDGVLDIRNAQSTLMTFKRFAESLTGLYLTYVVKYGLAKFENREELLVKVEHHDIRISEALGIIKTNHTKIPHDSISIKLSEFFRDMCIELNIDVIDLDSALWALGRYGCSLKDEMHCKSICSLYELCDRENMFGSYYKSGNMKKGEYWKRKPLQQILGFSQDEIKPKRLFDKSGIKLSDSNEKPSIDNNVEKLSLFENE